MTLERLSKIPFWYPTQTNVVDRAHGLCSADPHDVPGTIQLHMQHGLMVRRVPASLAVIPAL